MSELWNQSIINLNDEVLIYLSFADTTLALEAAEVLHEILIDLTK